jgi:hypothetical protein
MGHIGVRKATIMQRCMLGRSLDTGATVVKFTLSLCYLASLFFPFHVISTCISELL